MKRIMKYGTICRIIRVVLFEIITFVPQQETTGEDFNLEGVLDSEIMMEHEVGGTMEVAGVMATGAVSSMGRFLIMATGEAIVEDRLIAMDIRGLKTSIVMGPV